MENTLDTFLFLVRNEFGEKIDFSNIESEGFRGVICLNDHQCELSISIDDYSEHESDLSENEKKMLEAFIDYTQQEMRKQRIFIKNGCFH
jgi:hypothetical protein